MYRTSLVGWEQIICKPWQTLAVHLWLTNDNRFRPKLQFVVSMEKPNVVKTCLKLHLDFSSSKNWLEWIVHPWPGWAFLFCPGVLSGTGHLECKAVMKVLYFLRIQDYILTLCLLSLCQKMNLDEWMLQNYLKFSNLSFQFLILASLCKNRAFSRVYSSHNIAGFENRQNQ